MQQLKKQIRIEVRNAEYALEQSKARVDSARKARELAQKTFDITAKEQELGAGSNYQTLTARRDLSAAESALVAAMTAYQKAKIELERSVGTTLDANQISIESARTGIARRRLARERLRWWRRWRRTDARRTKTDRAVQTARRRRSATYP